MTEPAKLVSKVLVLEEDPACTERIKAFCEDNNLVPMRAKPANVMAVLRSNIDLGAIFLSESYIDIDSEGDGHTVDFVRQIQSIRPELPVFLRRSDTSKLLDFQERDRSFFSAAYTIDNLQSLQDVINEHLFSRFYPSVLVRGISEITKSIIESQFKDVLVWTEPPYIVSDRLIYGELFTLIPLESTWCRGYMMLQTEERPLIGFVETDKTHIATETASFRDINNVLGEITNMIWGSFKNRYITAEPLEGGLPQVPLIVNHLHRYISFGSEDPQLCFKYNMVDKNWDNPPLTIYQRFAFNLNWSPERFKEIDTGAEDLVQAGELEMF